MIKKRQKSRLVFLLIMFLLFPIVFYYLSPYVIIEGAIRGIVTGSFIVFGILFLSALFVGRLWCGWVCPAAGLQETCLYALDKKAKKGKGDILKYMVWVIWIGLILMFFIGTGGIISVDFLFMTKYGISVSEPANYIIYYAVLILILGMNLMLGKRAFCHYLCWMAPFMVIGRKISNLLKVPSMKLKVDKDKCIKCKQCNSACPMDIDVMTHVQNNEMEDPECILCLSCIDKCPKGVIRL